MAHPKIPVKLTKIDRLIEWAGWILAAVSWILTLNAYQYLPETIATHFDMNGQADDFGSKKNLFILPAIGTLLYAGLFILSRKPHLFNFPFHITEENAADAYQAAARALRLTNLAAISGISYLVYVVCATGPENSNGPGLWFMLLFETALLMPVIWMISRQLKKK